MLTMALVQAEDEWFQLFIIQNEVKVSFAQILGFLIHSTFTFYIHQWTGLLFFKMNLLNSNEFYQIISTSVYPSLCQNWNYFWMAFRIEFLNGLIEGEAELPTSTFLPYFVCFLKENTAVRFFLQKYWRVKVLHYTHYLCYECQSFWIIMFKNKAKIAPEST